jgi:hypothetical protein
VAGDGSVRIELTAFANANGRYWQVESGDQAGTTPYGPVVIDGAFLAPGETVTYPDEEPPPPTNQAPRWMLAVTRPWCCPAAPR